MSRIGRFPPQNAVSTRIHCPFLTASAAHSCSDTQQRLFAEETRSSPWPGSSPAEVAGAPDDRAVRPGYRRWGDSHQILCACRAPDLTRRWLQSPVPWVEWGSGLGPEVPVSAASEPRAVGLPCREGAPCSEDTHGPCSQCSLSSQ